MKKLYLIGCLLFCSSIVYCQNITKLAAKDALEIVTEKDTGTVLIDGRSASMFAEKHIEGAINIDAFAEEASKKLKSYLNTRTIIVYCSNHRRSEMLIEKLNELQYNGEIVFITDGINGWIYSGFAIKTNTKREI